MIGKLEKIEILSKDKKDFNIDFYKNRNLKYCTEDVFSTKLINPKAFLKSTLLAQKNIDKINFLGYSTDFLFLNIKYILKDSIVNLEEEIEQRITNFYLFDKRYNIFYHTYLTEVDDNKIIVFKNFVNADFYVIPLKNISENFEKIFKSKYFDLIEIEK